MYKLLFCPSLENNDTSGKSRAVVSPNPVCHGGCVFVYMLLGPPLPATMFSGEVVLVAVALAQTVRLPAVAAFAQESFQAVSGIYPFADTCVELPFVEFQNVVCRLA